LCSIKRPLTFWPLLALIFYTSSGGPFGIEGIVSLVGPLLAIVGYGGGEGGKKGVDRGLKYKYLTQVLI
jgi:hypothetical protein